MHLSGHTDNQGRHSRIHETAGSVEPTQNDAFSLKTEQKRTTTNNYSCTDVKLTVSSSSSDVNSDVLINLPHS